MFTFKNFGVNVFSDNPLIRIRDVPHLCEVVKNNKFLLPIGSGHSWSHVGYTHEGMLRIDIKNLDDVKIDDMNKQVVVGAE